MKGDSSCSLRGDCRVGGYGAYEDLSPRNHGLLRALACHTDPEGKEIYSSLHSLPFSSELKWNGGKEIDSSMHPTLAANVNTCGPEVPVKYTSGKSAKAASFRELSTVSHVDFITVEKMIKGQISVFEST